MRLCCAVFSAVFSCRRAITITDIEPSNTSADEPSFPVEGCPTFEYVKRRA